MRSIFVGITVGLVAMYSTAGATPPASIFVQGKLKDSLGAPVPAGVKTFTFKVFDAESGGTKVWPGGSGEDQPIATDAEGLWTARVGALLGLTDQVFSDSARWLEIVVDDGVNPPETLPRLPFASTPFALRVATVDGATGGRVAGQLNVGTNNTNFGLSAFVVGVSNDAAGTQSIVLGGSGNQADGEVAAVVGGSGNTSSGSHSIVSGESNTATGDWSSVSGGRDNLASGPRAAVVAGQTNAAVGPNAIVGAGSGNGVTGSSAGILAGLQNQAPGAFSGLVAGIFNVAEGEGAVVGGGGYNVARGNYSVVVGGGGGTFPVDSNVATGDNAFVGGGRRNRAEAATSVIGGGFQNTTEGFTNTLGGGSLNAARDTFSTVAGGTVNTANARGGSIGGGSNNVVLGPYGTVPGGQSNRVDGSHGLAGGSGAQALHDGSFVWADRSAGSLFASTAANQFLIRAAGGVGIGTNGPEAALHVRPGSAGSVSALSGSVGVFENSSNAFVSVLAPASSSTGLVFGSPLDNLEGGIIYNGVQVPRGLNFRTKDGSIHVVIDSMGNMGVGDWTPESKLKVAGDITASGCVIGSNIACPSDARFKTDIRDVTGALETLKRLRAVRYHWNTAAFADRDFAAGEQVGVLAQEVREVVPQAVVEMPDHYLAVDYSRLVPLLIESIKEQQGQIERLEADLANLRRR